MSVKGRSSRAAKKPARVGEQSPPAFARRLLLDTHVWLWWLNEDRRLGRETRKAIATAFEVRVSVASIWEIAIKSALGRLVLPKQLDLATELEEDGFTALPIELPHADGVRALPLRHRDPFDRMLVSQATVEGLTLVTADPAIARYEIRTLDAAS